MYKSPWKSKHTQTHTHHTFTPIHAIDTDDVWPLCFQNPPGTNLSTTTATATNSAYQLVSQYHAPAFSYTRGKHLTNTLSATERLVPEPQTPASPWFCFRKWSWSTFMGQQIILQNIHNSVRTPRPSTYIATESRGGTIHPEKYFQMWYKYNVLPNSIIRTA